MKISRHGSAKYKGRSEIRIDDPTVDWNTNLGCVQMDQKDVRDFSSRSHHDYTIDFTFEDLAAIIQAIVNKGLVEDRQLVIKELEPLTRRLFQLTRALTEPPSQTQQANKTEQGTRHPL